MAILTFIVTLCPSSNHDITLRPNGPAYKVSKYDQESHKHSLSNFRSGQCGEHKCEYFCISASSSGGDVL